MPLQEAASGGRWGLTRASAALVQPCDEDLGIHDAFGQILQELKELKETCSGLKAANAGLEEKVSVRSETCNGLKTTNARLVDELSMLHQQLDRLSTVGPPIQVNFRQE